MHSKIFKFFLLECIQGTKVTLVLRVQRRTLFLSMSNTYVTMHVHTMIMIYYRFLRFRASTDKIISTCIVSYCVNILCEMTEILRYFKISARQVRKYGLILIFPYQNAFSRNF